MGERVFSLEETNETDDVVRGSEQQPCSTATIQHSTATTDSTATVHITTTVQHSNHTVQLLYSTVTSMGCTPLLLRNGRKHLRFLPCRQTHGLGRAARRASYAQQFSSMRLHPSAQASASASTAQTCTHPYVAPIACRTLLRRSVAARCSALQTRLQTRAEQQHQRSETRPVECNATYVEINTLS